ncbi:helix-turn-helix transcriptional regulator [Bacillaceae bacterium SIJ1]|uniref:helix-turn-helix transcriptional regulator n=1 Tax=Litoribacterium kuwaitense TaxID=1398745 RepID=UPI0013EA3FE7|nr:helix-turn-helix transcriptional regulator [Litoribacterium kuwaitense]NGP46815.1 helix-turn-helix transcriptional regulator [Litoribacterium kuwaitense]
MKNRIAELRKERQMTQKDLANVLNVSRQTIISLENGRYNPSILLAHHIAKTFQQTIEDVFILKKETTLRRNK